MSRVNDHLRVDDAERLLSGALPEGHTPVVQVVPLVSAARAASLARVRAVLSDVRLAGRAR
jgi:hypothetical protein